jgi:thymidylate kinase
VREAFLQRARNNAARYSVIDASREVERVQADLGGVLEERL